MIEVVVREVRDVARGIKLLELGRADGAPLPAAAAGDHIDVTVTEGVTRSYSLLDPADPAPKVYTIAVALTENSRGGSRAVHESIQEGSRITVSAPLSGFVIDEEAELSVFLAGGIGITPILSAIRQLNRRGKKWELHYAARSRTRAAFLPELTEFAADAGATLNVHITDEAGHRVEIAAITEPAPPGAHLYCCGPPPMIDAFEAATANLPRTHVHVERFVNTLEAAAGGFVVELHRTGQELQVDAEESILDAVLDAGVNVEFSCMEGICGSCKVRVLFGEPDHRDAYLGTAEKAAGETMLICCSGSKGKRLVLDI